MFEQLTQLVKQFGQDAVVKNDAVPNEQNEAVMNEASTSIFSGLQKMASEGGIEQLASLFQGKNAQDINNPAVQNLTQQLSGNLNQKFGLSTETSSGVAGNIITQVLGSLVNKAKDPNDKSFQISDIIGAITGGGAQTSGIMDAISKYGMQFGLDQNADGKVDMQDAVAVTKRPGGIMGFIAKLFGK